MEKENLNISEEVLENLTVDELVDLKVEVDDLLTSVNNIIANCN